MRTTALRVLTAFLAVTSLCLPVIGGEPEGVVLPEGTGVFYKSSSGFVALRTAPPVQAKAKGGLFTPPRAKLQFTGLQSTTQIREPRPAFLVKEMGWDDRACALIRLEPGKEAREVPFKVRINSVKEENLIPVTTKVLSLNPTPMQYPIFTITPQRDLEPGEYLIAFNPSGAGAYEFGVADGVKASD